MGDVIRYVTAEDLDPCGWACEGCDRPLAIGDAAYGVPVGVVVGDAPGDVDEVEGDYRCAACWLADTPVTA
jgi:hypothetical protein